MDDGGLLTLGQVAEFKVVEQVAAEQARHVAVGGGALQPLRGEPRRELLAALEPGAEPPASE